MDKNFGQILKMNREKMGITQDELAERIDLNRTYMSKLESKTGNPSFSTIEKICKGLGITVAEFFSGREEGKKPAIVLGETGKELNEDYIIKSTMIPIKVVNNIESFGRGKNVKEEFASGYVCIDKFMFDNPEDIIGLQMSDPHKISSLPFQESILLVDIAKKPLINRGLYLYETRSGSVDLGWIAVHGDKIVVFDMGEYKDMEGVSDLYLKEGFDQETLLGIVVGVIGKVGLLS